MARVLKVWEDGEPGGSLLTPRELRELNEAYARLEERYNGLRSNWEWFVREDYRPDKNTSILRRVEQN
ncbi:hypothetical protein V3F56_01410 [Moorellaceae bacterium AZ2]